MHNQFKDVILIKENQVRAILYTIRFNKHQISICAPLYKRKSFKHRKFNPPFEIIAQNPCYPWEWRRQNYSDTERYPII